MANNESTFASLNQDSNRIWTMPAASKPPIAMPQPKTEISNAEAMGNQRWMSGASPGVVSLPFGLTCLRRAAAVSVPAF